MPKVRASSATIGTTRGPSAGSFIRLPSMRTNAIVVLISLPSACSANAAVESSGGTASARAIAAPRRQRAAERAPPAVQVAHLGAVVGGLVEGERLRVGIAHRQREAVAEGEQAGAVELLRLVRRHPALRRLAHRVALHGLGEHDRRLAGVRDRGGERGVDLDRVVAAAAQPIDVLVAQVGDQRRSSGFWPKKNSRLNAPSLADSVWNWPSTVCANARISAWPRSRANSTSQSRAPQALDDVPAGAGEQRLELVDDPAVAAHRPVEALQVAVDDEGAVVEPLARRQRQRGDRLGLVHLAVAEEAPDATLLRPPAGRRAGRDAAGSA